jgi:hypothetical protein
VSPIKIYKTAPSAIYEMPGWSLASFDERGSLCGRIAIGHEIRVTRDGLPWLGQLCQYVEHQRSSGGLQRLPL